MLTTKPSKLQGLIFSHRCGVVKRHCQLLGSVVDSNRYRLSYNLSYLLQLISERLPYDI